MQVNNRYTPQLGPPIFSATRPLACPGQGETLWPCPDRVTFTDKSACIQRALDSSDLETAQKEQLVKELSAIPSQIWHILDKSELRIVAVPPGGDLSQTSAVRHFDPPDYEQRLQDGRRWLADTITRQNRTNEETWAGLPEAEFQKAMWRSGRGQILAQELLAQPEAARLGFRVGVARQPVSLEQLRQAADCEEAAATRWEEDFFRLNGELVERAGALIQAKQDVLLLPYPYRRGVPIKPDSLEYLKKQNDAELAGAMGANYWQSSLVAIHPNYIPDPGPETGHNRVLLHEVGHAIDRVLDRIQNEGLGQQHRRTMDALFAQDQQLEKQGVPRFSSPRAKDNVREYFAEAVEAYLTRDNACVHEWKPNNHHAWLRANNPELFNYVDGLFRRAYPQQLELAPLPANPDYDKPESLMIRFEKPYLELS